MTATKRAYLSKVEIFQDLSPSEMEHLERVTAMVTCEPGRVFYNPNEPAEVLFILKRGEVAISRVSPVGKKLIVETVGPGAIFGEMAIIGQRMYQTFAEALTECVICVMSRTDVEELLLADPQVAVRLVWALSDRLAQAEARIEEMAFTGVPARLASLLLRIASGDGRADAQPVQSRGAARARPATDHTSASSSGDVVQWGFSDEKP
jgi:CRP/FNR family transcriptional regulator, cyclic AMP receptor protein